MVRDASRTVISAAGGLARHRTRSRRGRPALGDLAAAVGIGLAAGVVGTAAMTASSTIEAKLRGRGASTTPARAASAILGVTPTDDRGEQRFNSVVHWGYGTVWGGARGVIGWLGLTGVAAASAHLTVVWGAEQVVLPVTGASEPATKWGAREIAVDLGHHLVYVAATGLAFAWLAGDRR